MERQSHLSNDALHRQSHSVTSPAIFTRSCDYRRQAPFTDICHTMAEFHSAITRVTAAALSGRLRQQQTNNKTAANNKQQTTQRHNTQTTHHHRGGGLCVCVRVSVTAGELASTIVWSFYNRNQSLFTTWRADAGRRIVFSTFDCRAIFGTSHYRTTTTAISRSDVKPI